METIYRDALLDVMTDEKTGVVTTRLSFASIFPVLRKDSGGKFYEILSLAPGDCNLGQLNTQGLVFQDHDERNVIGLVVKNSAQVEPDKKVRADIQICDSYWQARIKNSPRNIPVSVGYSRLSVIREFTSDDGIPAREYSWRPYEVSLLTVQAADSSIGIGRALKTFMKPRNTLLENLRKLADEQDGDDGGEFSRAALETYSLASVMKRQMSGCQFPTSDTLEGRMNQACKMPGFYQSRGTNVPWAALLTRDMQATTYGTGGAAVPTTWHPLIELLYTRSILPSLGVQIIPGLKGNWYQPRQSTAVQPAMASETGAAPQSGILFDAGVMLPPRRATVQVVFSSELQLQTAGEIETTVRRAVAKAIGLEVERLALFGQGAANEPQGLFNMTGVGSLLFGAASWANITAAEQAVSLMNSEESRLGFAISPNTRNRWKNIPRIANGSLFLMEGGMVNDYPAKVSNVMAANDQMAFGDWSDFFIGVFGEGFDFLTDPFTQCGSAKIIVTCHFFFNVFAGHPQNFVVSADSAAQ